jgi:capsule polysaccharide export protein KpsE/RkpR
LNENQKNANVEVTVPLLTDEPGGDAVSTASSEVFANRLRLLWRTRRFLVRSMVAGLIASTAVAFLIPKQFVATARLMPPDDKSSSGLAMMAAMSGQLGGLASLAGDVFGVKSSGALFVGILGSRTVGDRLVDRFSLKQEYGKRLEEDACAELISKSAISEDRKSGIIIISVTDRSPQRAAALAQAYVEELDRLVSQLSTSSAHRERVFLEERLKTVKEDLDNAAQRFGQFASKNTAIDIQAQGKAMVDAAAQLQGEMIAAEAELQGLRQIYTDSNVRVRQVEARIGELQRQLDKLGGSNSPVVKNAISADDPSYPTIRELPLLGITYSDLYRRTKIEEVVYETLTQQFELAKVQEAKETPSVRLLDGATTPQRKSYPPRLIIMAGGTLAFLVCASIWVLLASSWGETERSRPMKVLSLEILGDLRSALDDAADRGSAAARFVRSLPMRINRSSESSRDQAGK